MIKGKKLKKELAFEGSVIKKMPKVLTAQAVNTLGKVMIICN